MARFCTQCGTALSEEGNAPCPACGAEQSVAPSATDVDGARRGTFPVTFDAVSSEDGVELGVGGVKLKMDWVVRIAAVVLCVLFCLPMVTFSALGIFERSANGFQAAFGVEGDNGSLLMLLLFLIPVALFLAFQFREMAPFLKGRLYLTATALCVAGIIGLIIFAIRVKSILLGVSGAEEMEFLGDIGDIIKIKMTFGYYLSLLVYLVVAAASAFCMLMTKDRD